MYYHTSARVRKSFSNNCVHVRRSLPDTYCCFGLSIDLLEKMSNDLEFDFHLYLVADGTFGSRKLQWNGVVGDLVSGSAHMAFCPLSVTSARSVAYTHISHCFRINSATYAIECVIFGFRFTGHSGSTFPRRISIAACL